MMMHLGVGFWVLGSGWKQKAAFCHSIPSTRNPLRSLCLTLLLLPFFASPAFAKPIVADMASHEIRITSDFTGARLLMFGARNDPGDIIIVVRGPAKPLTIRKKERMGALWVNRYMEHYPSIPLYYAIATSRPFEDITRSRAMLGLGIGADTIIGDNGTERSLDFKQAWMEHLREESLLVEGSGAINFIGETLFKTVIPFPDSLPRGTYTAETYLFSDGQLIGMQATPISVVKSGFDAFVYDSANEQPLLYGIVAVLVALSAGWGASVIFGRIN